MKRLLVAMLIQFVLLHASAIEAFPIAIRSPTPEGAKAIAIRIDAQNLYVKTSSNEIIRVDKLALLAGNVNASAATLEQWAAIKELAPDLVLSDKQEWTSTWRLGDLKILVKDAYCAEGLQQQHALQIAGRKVDTGLADCMGLFEPLHFNGKLWLRTNDPGEYGDLPGVGILVFDLAKKRRFARISSVLVGGDAGLMLVDADLDGVWVVNDQAIHFFDRALKRRALAYYSEQFDPTGENWSVTKVSNERRSHNQFAVAARIIMTPHIRRAEADDAYAARLAQNRWVTVDGIADYKKAVSRLPLDVQSKFSVRYDNFERRYFPFWAGKYMTKENGGSNFLAGSRLLSCLYESAGSPDWLPREMVLRIAAASQNMNWAEAQLYEPKCSK